MAGKSHGAMEKDYQAESDHHTLSRAAEIHGDPDRMKNAHKHHKKQTKALDKVGSMFGHKSPSKR